MTDLGRLLIVFGILLLFIGVLALVLGRLHLPIGRLPGDLSFRRNNWSVYLPITSSILFSVLLTLVLWAVNHLRR